MGKKKMLDGFAKCLDVAKKIFAKRIPLSIKHNQIKKAGLRKHERSKFHFSSSIGLCGRRGRAPRDRAGGQPP